MIRNFARERLHSSGNMLLGTCITLMLAACVASPERSQQFAGKTSVASQVTAEASGEQAQTSVAKPVEAAPAPTLAAPAKTVQPAPEAPAVVSHSPSTEPPQASPAASPMGKRELAQKSEPKPEQVKAPSKKQSPIPPESVRPSAASAAEATAPNAPSATPVKPAPKHQSQTPSPAEAELPAIARTEHAIEGRITLLAGARQTVSQDDLPAAVVYFLPDRRPPAAAPGRFAMTTRSKRFDPALLVVPAGSTVNFPNSDPILHNVYSNTPGLTFDLGVYGESESRAHRFDRTGMVAVHCNVHATMQANIMALETRFFTRASGDGSFKLEGVPAGPGTLVAWHPRASALTQAMAVPATAPMALLLTACKPRVGR